MYATFCGVDCIDGGGCFWVICLLEAEVIFGGSSVSISELFEIVATFLISVGSPGTPPEDVENLEIFAIVGCLSKHV